MIVGCFIHIYFQNIKIVVLNKFFYHHYKVSNVVFCRKSNRLLPTGITKLQFNRRVSNHLLSWHVDVTNLSSVVNSIYVILGV